MERLRREAFDIVIRTAGSHSPIDVIGIRLGDNKIVFIQSKPKKMSQAQRDKLEEQHGWLNDEFQGEFKVE